MKLKISSDLSLRITLILLSINTLVQYSSGQAPLYKNTALPIEQRISDLLKRMTLDEKIAQMSNFGATQVPLKNGMLDKAEAEKVCKGMSYGAVNESYRNITVEDMAKRVYALQDYFLNHTRLGIPALMTSTSVHGLIADGTTIYPQMVAIGSTWNRDLIEKMASAIAEESSACGFVQDLGPNVDCAVDPRWGRFEECFGQDPFHVAEMGIAYVRGMQGNLHNAPLQNNKIFTTIKHYTGYSKPSNGINIGPSSMSERELRTVHVYPYTRIIETLDQWSIMPSYNALNNIPCHASSFLLRDILRKELGFKGYTYSDWGAVEMLHNLHKVSETYKDAAIKAVKAGVSLNAPRMGCYENLKDAVEKGELDVKWIDEAVSDVLRIKFKAGLFDGQRNKFDEDKFRKVIHSQEHIDLARKVAEEECILLTNQNQILPLDINTLKSIAVIGPNSNLVQFGDYAYSHENRFGITVLQGIRNLVGNKAQINFAKGCGITDLSTSGFKEATEAALKSDVVILVCGGSSRQFGGVGWLDRPPENDPSVTCGEGFDRAILTLPGVQEDLVKEIIRTGKPIILVLLNGRPYTFSFSKEKINAILEAWYPGEQGGNAIAGILFGNVNPSGKLAFDWPQTTGHIYTQYDYLPSARGYYLKPGSFANPGRDYVEHTPDALFPFGFGLSYTSFELTDFLIKDTVLSKTGVLEMDVTVRNTGKMEGKEVVQLYVHDQYASVTVPQKQLKDFEKISLQPGESGKVHFSLPVRELAIWNEQMKEIVEPGTFELMIGKSSSDILLKRQIHIK
jgi:beta-glucosidase